jgi:PAS domain S-box-containing protein
VTLNLWDLAQRTRAMRTNPALGYPLALALICLAVAARLAGGSLLSSFPFLTFYPPVVAAAFLCGLGPALVTMLLGLALSVYFMFDPTSTLRFAGGGLAIAIGFYLCTNTLIIALMQSMLQALERQHATARRLELAMNAGGMAVWEYDLPGETMVATPELNQLLGLPLSSRLDVAQVNSLVPPGEWERLRALARRSMESGERFFDLEFQARRPDDSLRWYALNAEILKAPNGTAEKILGVLTDVTARKDVEQGLEEAIARLKEREKDLDAVMDVSGIASFDFDPRTMALKPSPRLNRLYGYPENHRLTIEDMRTRYFPPEGEDYVREAQRRAADPDVRAYELDLRLRMPDGKIKWINGRGEYIRDADGKAVRARGLVMDITARKELEQTRELLLKELDHRIKNLLATVGAISAQTLRGTISLEQARANLDGRIQVLARAHELLTSHQWHDMNMRDGDGAVAAPCRHPDHGGRAGLSLKPQARPGADLGAARTGHQCL